MCERFCSNKSCMKPMDEGFCIADGEEYYCSEACLHSEMTQEEYLELFDQDLAYWTQWEEEVES